MLIRLCSCTIADVFVLSPRLRYLLGSCIGCVWVWVQSEIEASGGATCARDLVRYVFCETCRTENVGQFNYCWFCGTQPFRDPDATAVRIDVGKLEARRAVVLAAMAKRPGQRRKSKIGDDFDAFLLARSGGRRGWATAIDDDVFDWACFLYSQGHGTTWVHDRSCPGVGPDDDGACLPGSGCAKRYAAGSIDKAFISKLRMAMREQLGKVEE